MRPRAIALAAVLAVLAMAAGAETPSERARMYFDALAKRDYAASAAHLHAAHLAEFRETMSFYKHLPAAQQGELIASFFGPGHDARSIEGLDDAAYFASFLGAVMRRAEAAGGLDFAGMEILGEVAEEPDVVHLVTRNRVRVGAISVEAMEVVSLRRHEDGWRVLLSGKLKGLPAQLEAAFAGR